MAYEWSRKLGQKCVGRRPNTLKPLVVALLSQADWSELDRAIGLIQPGQ